METVTNFDGSDLSVLLNVGNGTFAADVSYGAGSEPLSVAIGDLDGDGGHDLAVANFVGDGVSILLNVDDGTPPTSSRPGACRSRRRRSRKREKGCLGDDSAQ